MRYGENCQEFTSDSFLTGNKENSNEKSLFVLLLVRKMNMKPSIPRYIPYKTW